MEILNHIISTDVWSRFERSGVHYGGIIISEYVFKPLSEVRRKLCPPPSPIALTHKRNILNVVISAAKSPDERNGSPVTARRLYSRAIMHVITEL